MGHRQVDRLGDAGTTFGLGALVPFHATVLLGVNPNVEPLTRAPLRQAISLAVDRSTLTEAVFGPTAQPLQGLVGQPQSVLVTMLLPAGSRVIGPNDAVTMDFRADRLNVEIGADGRIAKVGCY